MGVLVAPTVAARALWARAASRADRTRPLPGDELTAEPADVRTIAVDVRAPVEEVWPWIVQIGHGRGGFYSYDALENLFGLGIHSSSEVRPEWQDLRPGDRVVLAPVGWMGLADGYAFRVARVEHDRALVLRQSPPEHPWDGTWSFVLIATGPRSCRLLSRSRTVRRPGPAAALARAATGVGELVTFAMTRRMLHGVKARAERSAASTDLPPIRPMGRGAAGTPVDQLWARLAAPGAGAAAFERSMVVGLPEPAQRFLLASITEGTPIPRGVLLAMDGRIRIGRWLPFAATQVLTPPDGFVWTARAGWPGASVQGFDRYGDDGTGEMRWRLGGVLSLIRATGADVTRSAAGRLAAEAVLVPTALLGPSVEVRAADQPDAFVAVWRIGAHRVPVTVHVHPDGRPARVTVLRWGNPGGMPFGEHRFGALFEGSRRFGGLTLPARITAGWFHGTARWEEGRFFDAHVRDVQPF